jgi:hypothetical protein
MPGSLLVPKPHPQYLWNSLDIWSCSPAQDPQTMDLPIHRAHSALLFKPAKAMSGHETEG